MNLTKMNSLYVKSLSDFDIDIEDMFLKIGDSFVEIKDYKAVLPREDLKDGEKVNYTIFNPLAEQKEVRDDYRLLKTLFQQKVNFIVTNFLIGIAKASIESNEETPQLLRVLTELEKEKGKARTLIDEKLIRSVSKLLTTPLIKFTIKSPIESFGETYKAGGKFFAVYDELDELDAIEFLSIKERRYVFRVVQMLLDELEFTVTTNESPGLYLSLLKLVNQFLSQMEEFAEALGLDIDIPSPNLTFKDIGKMIEYHNFAVGLPEAYNGVVITKEKVKREEKSESRKSSSHRDGDSYMDDVDDDDQAYIKKLKARLKEMDDISLWTVDMRNEAAAIMEEIEDIKNPRRRRRSRREDEGYLGYRGRESYRDRRSSRSRRRYDDYDDYDDRRDYRYSRRDRDRRTSRRYGDREYRDSRTQRSRYDPGIDNGLAL